MLDLNLIEDIKLNCAFYLSMVGLELAPLSLAIINHVCDLKSWVQSHCNDQDRKKQSDDAQIMMTKAILTEMSLKVV